MVEGNSIEADSAQRFIIERPRLTRLLNDAETQVIVLVAPAGYGKTTLVRQWVRQSSYRAVWITATPASADVAALGSDLAAAFDAVAPGIRDRLLARIAASARPDDDALDLARILADAANSSPDDTMLVIDDYHQLAVNPSAELLLQTLIVTSKLRAIVLSRTRPSWAAARRVLYGEITALGSRELAFTRSEGLQLLGDLTSHRAGTILQRSRGWPALVRLAALSRGPSPLPVAEGTVLYEYLAEELYQATPPDVQAALLELTPLQTLTTGILTDVLGPSATGLADRAVALGFLSRHQRDTYELHPLLRDFLEMKLHVTANVAERIQRSFTYVIESERWDDAYSIITAFRRFDLVPPLIEKALPSMLAGNRLTSLTEWVTGASNAGIEHALIDVAAAEVDLRLGNVNQGLTQALHAARNLPLESTHLSRAYAVAGTCAHFLGRPEESLEWGQKSEATAKSQRDAQRAVWTQLATSFESEVDDPSLLLRRFEGVADTSVESAMRIFVGKMVVSIATGSVAVAFDEARLQESLAEHSHDVFATTSFICRTAYNGMLAARYADALPLARRAASEIKAAGVSVAAPHVLSCLAGINLGLRRFRRAAALLDRLAEELLQRPNAMALANWHALKARLLISTGAIALAPAEIEAGLAAAPVRSMYGELLGLKALALATGDTHADADQAATDATAATRDVQAVTLAALARAILASRRAARYAERDIERAENILLERENYDSLVYAFRAYPELLRLLRERNIIAEPTLMRVVRDARDDAIAASAGWDIEPAKVVRPVLTARENQVFDLMRRGQTNAEIAKALFITEATVKVHVRHILEKFGARSRIEAVVRFARF